MSAMFLQFKGRFIRVATVFAFFLTFFSCSDAVRDDFPRRSFVGYFDLSYAEYSKSVFTARRDMYNTPVGNNGIIVYRQGDAFYAFDLMCPHEKSFGCSVQVDIENNTSRAECECCGSVFLFAIEYWDVLEGPAKQGLHPYRTGVTSDNVLVVKSGY
jgi:nitrite reductase/ring-hydroxylating ferredoxin subunit